MREGNTILTLDNGYHLWARTDNVGGDIQLLCLHGGPGGNHEYYENFSEKLSHLNVQVTMYDQLGSWYSDQPDFNQQENVDKFLRMDYFVDEIEEVRQKLGLTDFYLIGQSWGGALVQEYVLKYPHHLKGVIISSMTDNIDEYIDNINAIRAKEFTEKELAFLHDCEARNDFNEQYEELIERLNRDYIDRRQPQAIRHLVSTVGEQVYNYFQGDNEFVVTGKLAGWDRSQDIHKIQIPTLITYGEHESMPLAAGYRMAETMPNARFVTTPNGGHHHMVDNAPVYFDHLSQFLLDVEKKTFNS
ncbi:MAG: proline iminopeptidase-family hydrolase [Tetragenococcus koreensis]|nr:proline iminopeptidase-family hydrolase [Tetragenococcus koreensis]MDN6568475.1 proline iminopeptidase-family hydrolase [Tetragenococcus halophilus]MDN6729274.1 proline iminopeptidase-family hydrolase [Alkalibacterium sp.]MDN6268168.1 proline iminopeptidase-family hydrolase [Tetragenococcus koreensis]MDN6541815.1 proline iminopeptidase-family hydrolase [Tetragenococcus koreensis]